MKCQPLQSVRWAHPCRPINKPERTGGTRGSQREPDATTWYFGHCPHQTRCRSPPPLMVCVSWDVPCRPFSNICEPKCHPCEPQKMVRVGVVRCLIVMSTITEPMTPNVHHVGMSAGHVPADLHEKHMQNKKNIMFCMTQMFSHGISTRMFHSALSTHNVRMLLSRACLARPCRPLGTCGHHKVERCMWRLYVDQSTASL